MPQWLTIIAIISLIAGALSAIVIIIDLLNGNKQHMWIMNLVWPITGLWAGPPAVWAYYRYGRAARHKVVMAAKKSGEKPPSMKQPFAVAVAKGALHCGSGCTLGDIIAEWFAVAVPLVLFGRLIFGSWVYDYAFAYVLGIIFQYFTIKPMRNLTVGKGFVAAVKADTLSLTSWQVGMYGWMAIATFAIFGVELHKTDPVFWFMMQIAMYFGFLTAYPTNWWLLRRGIKERM